MKVGPKMKLKGSMGGESPPTLNTCYFAWQKQQHNVRLKSNIMDPDQLVNYCH